MTVPVDNQHDNSASILFLDDEETTLDSIKSLFSGENYKQYYFTSASKALKSLESMKTEVIVADMKMPEMSGAQFLKAATERNPHSIKIILSGSEEKSTVLDMLAGGIAHYYLMKPWDDNELKSTIKKFCSINEDLQKKKLRKCLNSFSKFPAATRISWNLTKMLNEENVNINKITEEIEFHPFLAAKLLQIANSVSYGVRKEIVSVRSAVILIGMRQLKAFVISFELLNSFSTAMDKRFQKTIDQFWHSSLKKAIIAKRVAEVWHCVVDIDLAFISALLSDIGYLAWLYTVPEDFNAFLLLSGEKQMSITEAEKNLFLFEHTKIGAVLLKLWNLPPQIIHAVENHHSHEAKDDIIKIMQIADYLNNPEAQFPHDPSIDELALKCKDILKI